MKYGILKLTVLLAIFCLMVGCGKKTSKPVANGVYDITGETGDRAKNKMITLKFNDTDSKYEYLYIKNSKEVYYLTLNHNSEALLLEKHVYGTGDIFSGGNYTVETNCSDTQTFKQKKAAMSSSAKLMNISKDKDKRLNRQDSRDLIIFIQTLLINKCDGMKLIEKPKAEKGTGTPLLNIPKGPEKDLIPNVLDWLQPSQTEGKGPVKQVPLI